MIQPSVLPVSDLPNAVYLISLGTPALRFVSVAQKVVHCVPPEKAHQTGDHCQMGPQPPSYQTTSNQPTALSDYRNLNDISPASLARPARNKEGEGI